MRKKDDEEIKIRRRLHKIRKESRNWYLELKGIDTGKLEKIESQTNKEYSEIISALHNKRIGEGEAREKIHRNFLETRKTRRKMPEIPQDVFAEILGKHFEAQRRAPFDPCPNPVDYPDNVGYLEEIDIDPLLADGGTGTGSVNPDEPNNIAQPKLEISSSVGGVNTVTVSAAYKFAFYPVNGDYFCIEPEVLMSGYWLLWIWGGCDAENQGSGNLYAKVKVRVSQLDSAVKEIEHTVVEHSTPTSEEGAIDYKSEDGGTSMTVYLQGGFTATITVKCEIYGQLTNLGRIIVDMQSGEHGFYFKVPKVRIGLSAFQRVQQQPAIWNPFGL